MRKLWALLWGGWSAALGLLRTWPSIPPDPFQGLTLAQEIVGEDPGLGLVAGGVGLWHGLRARSRLSVILSLIGIVLGLRPIVRRSATGWALADAMRDGLGLGWQRDLPPEVHQRFLQQHRTDLIGTLHGLLRARINVTRDVLFAAPDGHALRLDLYDPVKVTGARPAVIVVHGGAWSHGDKGDYSLGLHNYWLAAQGVVVFDIQYRLDQAWPAPLCDVKCAIRWVKLNAARCGVDPDRIALLGRSAGAHLALLAAYTANDPALPSSCFAADGDRAVDEHVRAVIAVGAPADLRLMAAEHDGAVHRLLGGSPDQRPDAYAAASPVTHVRPGLPPTLLVHGQRDRTVPPNHAELLANHLWAAGNTAVLLRVPGGRHGVDALPVGLNGPLVQYDVDRFLAWAFFGQNHDIG